MKHEPNENARYRHRKIAIHEAGHALCYAALNPLPEDIELYVSDIREPLQGSVRTSVVFRSESNVLQWKMLTDIAGASAERLLTGKYVVGSFDDFEKWQNTAIVYLQQQYEGLYFVKPQDTMEQAHNIDMLNKLLKKQFEQMRDFIHRNIQVLEELADVAVTQGRLSKAELKPFLACVELPDDFPRISSSDWV